MNKKFQAIVHIIFVVNIVASVKRNELACDLIQVYTCMSSLISERVSLIFSDVVSVTGQPGDGLSRIASRPSRNHFDHLETVGYDGP